MAKAKILFVFGTRPELIKMIPLMVTARRDPSVQAILCSTGQHRDMLDALYKFFSIKPDIDLALMKAGQSLGSLHATIMEELSVILQNYKPDWTVVQGDTTTAQAAAMAAFYARVPVAHVEAGLRTYDMNSPFPEEMNRRVITQLSQLHLCPTEEAAQNLAGEKLDANTKIAVTGNTGIDTLLMAAEHMRTDQGLTRDLSQRFSYLAGKKFVLMTMHRRENFGAAQKQILQSCLELVKSRAVHILFPVHPNPAVRQAVEEVFSSEMGQSVFRINDDFDARKVSQNSGKIFLVDPLDYPALVYNMQRCEFVMTDSGGLQEEAPSFGKKILVLRDSTERPEGVQAGFSILVGTDAQKIIGEAQNLLDQQKHWDGEVPKNPYGDGRASERILQLLTGSGDQSFFSTGSGGAGLRSGDQANPIFK